MIRKISHWLFPIIVAALLAGCSSTTLSGSWRSPDFQGQISKVYLVGVSKSEINRRMFETQFAQELESYGVNGIPSYKDLPDAQKADSKEVDAWMKKNGADSMLITRLVGTRTEEVVTPGRISEYGSWPTRGYSYPSYYRHWGSYYDRCCSEIIYEPPTVTQYEVATIEANLYEAKSGELIWSAQLETVIESDLQKLVADFIKTVARDLRQQGLI
ncbi:MAG: hypothetical protein NDI73_02800 [Desulfuromonadales bacterium]|nr:hypothetical protein [Desulfuromonadales bacterium]